MSRLFLTATIAIVAMILMFGCSDDDCPTCPTEQYLRVNGYFTVIPGELRLNASVRAVDGSMPDIDSATVNGSPATLLEGFSLYDSYYSLGYNESPSSVQSGDTIPIIIYTPRGKGTCRVVALEYVDDAPVLLSHSQDAPFDTVDISTEIEVVWSSVPLADWYAYEVWTYHEENEYYTVLQSLRYEYTHDTSMVITAEDNAYGGQLWVDILALTGPYPENGGNFTGTVIDGAIHCFAWEGLTLIVDDGFTTAADMIPPNAVPPISDEDRARMLIDQLVPITH